MTASQNARAITKPVVGNLIRGFSRTFGLPGPQLVLDLLHDVQYGQLALGIVQLQPFYCGFELVQPFQNARLRLALDWPRSLDLPLTRITGYLKAKQPHMPM